MIESVRDPIALIYCTSTFVMNLYYYIIYRKWFKLLTHNFQEIQKKKKTIYLFELSLTTI